MKNTFISRRHSRDKIYKCYVDIIRSITQTEHFNQYSMNFIHNFSAFTNYANITVKTVSILSGTPEPGKLVLPQNV